MLPTLGLLALSFAAAAATQAAEQSANTLEIKLYQMTESEWAGSPSSGFKSDIATAASAYCSANTAVCGGQSSFSSSDVAIGALEVNSKSLFVNFYVDVPGASATPWVLPTAVLEEVSRSARDAIKASTGAYITYIGETYLGIPYDSTSNAVVIPLAVLVVVVVAAVTLGLVKWQARQDHERQKAKRKEQKASLKAQPNNPAALGPPTSPPRKRRVVKPAAASNGLSNGGNKVVPNDGHGGVMYNTHQTTVPQYQGSSPAAGAAAPAGGAPVFSVGAGQPVYQPPSYSSVEGEQSREDQGDDQDRAERKRRKAERRQRRAEREERRRQAEAMA